MQKKKKLENKIAKLSANPLKPDEIVIKQYNPYLLHGFIFRFLLFDDTTESH
jgi:hypothetical protein